MVGKLRDLVTLVSVGLVLLLSVGISGLVGGCRRRSSTWSAWAPALEPLLVGAGRRWSACWRARCCSWRCSGCSRDPHTPKRSLLHGALLGAIGFEILKQLSGLLLSLTKGTPAFQAFGIALILVVWISYFSRVLLYAAAWAHTSPEARAQREEDAGRGAGAADAGADRADGRRGRGRRFAAAGPLGRSVRGGRGSDARAWSPSYEEKHLSRAAALPRLGACLRSR